MRASLYSGLVFLLLLLVGVTVAGFLPPPSSSMSVDEIVRMYVDNSLRIKVGLVIMLFGAGFTIPFSVALFYHVKEAEGGKYAPMAYVNLCAGPFTVLAVGVPVFAMAAALYRAEDGNSAAVVASMHDLAWLWLLGFVTPAVFHVVAIAVAIFGDRRSDPTYPKWVAYLNLFCGLCFATGIADFCFTGGPFAYDGILAFWLAFGAFGVWIVVMVQQGIRIMKRDERDVTAAPLQRTPYEVHAE
ncbi:hypothetical protein AB5J62_25040 [Amycolatopsis sp. cg5]|uniref:hypothetical protein n=1 Tax=Amycolatopsis sp. cg5 TaxID=3238802 RepID=UPI003524B947